MTSSGTGVEGRASPQRTPRELPHSLEAEQAVLGGILTDETVFGQVAAQLRADDFYPPAHGHVYQACEELAKEGRPLDPITIQRRLDAKKLLGTEVEPSLPLALGRAIGSAANVPHYARIVRELAHVRRMMHAAQDVVDGGYECGDNVQAFLCNAPQRLLALAEEAVGSSGVLGASEIFAKLPPPRWLCEALDVTPGPPVLVAGYGYSGKTVAIQDFALAVAVGDKAWGEFQVRRGRVLHLDYEQGAYLTRQRYQRLARARGIDPRELEGWLDLKPFPEWYLDSDAKDELLRLCDPYDFVIWDSFRACCPTTDENASEARAPLDRLTRASERTGTTNAVLHHARKPPRDGQSSGGARMAIRGSGALYDASGSVLVLEAEKGQPPTVVHDKAKFSGITHPDFRLWIEDVERDGDPRGGLRVTSMDVRAGGAGPEDAHHRELLTGVMAEVTKAGGSYEGGNADLALALHARKVDVGLAVNALLRERTLGRPRRGVLAISTPGTGGTTTEDASDQPDRFP